MLCNQVAFIAATLAATPAEQTEAVGLSCRTRYNGERLQAPAPGRHRGGARGVSAGHTACAG